MLSRLEINNEQLTTQSIFHDPRSCQMADRIVYVSISILSGSLKDNANYARRPVASAVILPPDAPKSPRNKRRQSSASASDTASKRPKFSPNGRSNSPSTIRASPPIETIKDDPSANAEPRSPTIDRRKSSVQEEKKRGQRLFGGLLSTLSQSTPNGQQKRRLEIEKRQKERAAQQKAEDRAEKAEKLANLKAIRKIEQVKFDEQSVGLPVRKWFWLQLIVCL